jgi:hypothetical protein
MAGLLRRLLPLLLALPVLLLRVSLSDACPFCGMQGPTLTGEVGQAKLVLYGELANAREQANGDGTTDLVGDIVLITTIDKAPERQLGQIVSVNLERTPLREELKRLARETGANLVLDPRTVKEGQTALTLRLEEVPLETAVDVLADEAGLHAVRLHNVLYVTSEARAEKLRKAQPTATPSFPGWRVWPDGKGGFRIRRGTRS